MAVRSTARMTPLMDGEELAEHFAPVLVLAHEYDPPDGGEVDYHPRDIRLVASQIRGRMHEGSGPREIIGRLARGLPRQTLVLVALIIASSSLVLRDLSEILSDQLDTDPSSGLSELAFGVFTLAATILLAGHAMPQMLRTNLLRHSGWALVLMGGALFSAAAFGEFGSLIDPGSWEFRLMLACILYGATWMMFSLLMWVWDRLPASVDSRPGYVRLRTVVGGADWPSEPPFWSGPEHNLKKITEEAEHDPERAERMFLTYHGVGAPGDTAAHRVVYDKLLMHRSFRSYLPAMAASKYLSFKDSLHRDSLQHQAPHSDRPRPTRTRRQPSTDSSLGRDRSATANSHSRLSARGSRDQPLRRVHRRERDLQEMRRAEAHRSALPVTVYARVVNGTNRFSGHVAIQYWMAYFYNDWDNTHEMDWEHVTVFLERTERGFIPEACAFSVHTSGLVARWAEVERAPAVRGRKGEHPIVHVAHGSHANYPRPGHHRTYLRFAGLRFTGNDLPSTLGRSSPYGYVDRAQGWYDGVCVRPKVRYLPPPCKHGIWGHECSGTACTKALGLCERDFRWLNIRGKWGWPGGLIGGASAPQSPTRQDAWRDPFFWLDQCEPVRPSLATSILQAPDDGLT